MSPCRSGTLCCQAAGRSLPDFEVFSRYEELLCQNCCAEELFLRPGPIQPGILAATRGHRHDERAKSRSIIAEITFPKSFPRE